METSQRTKPLARVLVTLDDTVLEKVRRINPEFNLSLMVRDGLNNELKKLRGDTMTVQEFIMASLDGSKTREQKEVFFYTNKDEFVRRVQGILGSVLPNGIEVSLMTNLTNSQMYKIVEQNIVTNAIKYGTGNLNKETAL